MDFAGAFNVETGIGSGARRQQEPPVTERRALHMSDVLLAEDFSIRDTGTIRGHTPELQLALPYRGLFTWDVGLGQTLLDANQYLLIGGNRDFTERQPIRAVGHSSLILTPTRDTLSDLLACAGDEGKAIRLDVAIPISAQMRLLLQHWLALPRGEATNPLQLDELAVATFREAMRSAPSSRPFPSPLVARTKELLHELVSEPLSLQQLADALGVSPVYLTQTFSRSEGMPLYRYQLHLRLAQAMVELPGCDDITALALDLGFSSHSHFTTAFKAFARQTPSAFRSAFRTRCYGTGRRAA
jgi:AraC family transcriptional regulator